MLQVRYYRDGMEAGNLQATMEKMTLKPLGARNVHLRFRAWYVVPFSMCCCFTFGHLLYRILKVTAPCPPLRSAQLGVTEMELKLTSGWASDFRPCCSGRSQKVSPIVLCVSVPAQTALGRYSLVGRQRAEKDLRRRSFTV